MRLKSRAGFASQCLLALCLTAVAACDPKREPNQPTARGVEDAVDAPEGAVSVRVRGTSFKILNGDIDASSRKKMAQDGVMRSGDAFELEVELDKPAHVYLMQFLPDGKATLHHPVDEAKALLPAGRHRVPTERDEVFRLDQTSGGEVIFVIVSKNPLTSEERQLVDEVRALRPDGHMVVAYDFPPQEVKAVQAFYDTTAPELSDSAPKPIASVPAPIPVPPVARPSNGCGPRPMVKEGMKARGDSCTKVPPSGRVGLKARGVERFKPGQQEIVATTTDADGVATFVLRINHQPAE